MITRRQLVIASAATTLTPLTTSAFAAPTSKPTFTLGKQYLQVNPPVPSATDKIEVVDFFAYYCPHCYRFAPIFQDWELKQPKDVEVIPCPVAWNEELLPFTETYYALEALNLLQKLHVKFFESVVFQTHTYDFKDPSKGITSFMVENGVNADLWTKTMNSFTVKNKSKQAMNLWQAYGVDSTPSVGVAGIYLTGSGLVGTHEGVPACLDFLVNEVRQSRKAKK